MKTKCTPSKRENWPAIRVKQWFRHRIGITEKANSSFFHGHACSGGSYVKTRLSKPESSSA